MFRLVPCPREVKLSHPPHCLDAGSPDYCAITLMITKLHPNQSGNVGVQYRKSVQSAGNIGRGCQPDQWFVLPRTRKKIFRSLHFLGAALGVHRKMKPEIGVHLKNTSVLRCQPEHLHLVRSEACSESSSRVGSAMGKLSFVNPGHVKHAVHPK